MGIYKLLSSRIVTNSILILLSLAVAPQSADADSAKWNLNPVSGDWNTATNWTPAMVPNGAKAAANFQLSNVTQVSISAETTVNSIVFPAGATAFTIATPATGAAIELSLVGAGITNESGVVQNFLNGVNGWLLFSKHATVGSDVVITNSGGFTDFDNFATAGEATLINQGETAGTGQSVTFFLGSASADHAVIMNNSPMDGARYGGFTTFEGKSNAGDSTITSFDGAYVGFQDGATAGNATLIAQGGSIKFIATSTGGTARVELFAFGMLDLTNRFTNGMSIGSLEGDGYVFLGRQNLSIGSNSLSTTFSGLIQDGTSDGHGAITKIGTGTLALTGSNIYTGGTIVTGGALIAGESTGSATGTAAVRVNSGILGGNGTIAGAVTVGTGSGAGAFLAPAAGARKAAMLTIQSALTFKADSTYTYTLKAKKHKSQSDQVIAKGVTIESGAQFNFVGTVQGKLRQGTSFSVISNTASTPIGGTFANLPDGAILSVSGNNLQASYTVGDGNDLTLTVVP
jgi:autotransporter-associated beta strand protein